MSIGKKLVRHQDASREYASPVVDTPNLPDEPEGRVSNQQPLSSFHTDEIVRLSIAGYSVAYIRGVFARKCPPAPHEATIRRVKVRRAEEIEQGKRLWTEEAIHQGLGERAARVHRATRMCEKLEEKLFGAEGVDGDAPLEGFGTDVTALIREYRQLLHYIAEETGGLTPGGSLNPAYASLSDADLMSEIAKRIAGDKVLSITATETAGIRAEMPKDAPNRIAKNERPL